MSTPHQWRWPIVLGVPTPLGLLVALVGEGMPWWPAARAALAAPLAVGTWHSLRQ